VNVAGERYLCFDPPKKTSEMTNATAVMTSKKSNAKLLSGIVPS
jgi:hypothetical protein